MKRQVGAPLLLTRTYTEVSSSLLLSCSRMLRLCSWEKAGTRPTPDIQNLHIGQACIPSCFSVCRTIGRSAKVGDNLIV